MCGYRGLLGLIGAGYIGNVDGYIGNVDPLRCEGIEAGYNYA